MGNNHFLKFYYRNGYTAYSPEYKKVQEKGENTMPMFALLSQYQNWFVSVKSREVEHWTDVHKFKKANENITKTRQ